MQMERNELWTFYMETSLDRSRFMQEQVSKLYATETG